MSLRMSLARYVRGLLEEPSTPTTSSPPTSNPLSTPPTMTPSTPTTSATSEAGLLQVVLETMERMQTQNLREIRGMVTDILQGREMDPSTLRASPMTLDPSVSPMPFDPPDYDSPSLEDLPGGIQAVFERQEQEQHDVRLLRTEQEVLAQQLDEARAKLMDPQGPDFTPSWSTD
jgi:hypothetical protein